MVATRRSALSGAIAAVPVTLKVPFAIQRAVNVDPKRLGEVARHILQMQIQRRDGDRDRLRRAVVDEGCVGLFHRDRRDLELKTRRGRRRRRRGLDAVCARRARRSRGIRLALRAQSCARCAAAPAAGVDAPRISDSRLNFPSRSRRTNRCIPSLFTSVTVAWRDGQVELPDRDAEIFPLHRFFFFVRRIDFEIRDRDARRLRVHVEMIAREMRLHVGLRAELARRDRRRQKRSARTAAAPARSIWSIDTSVVTCDPRDSARPVTAIAPPLRMLPFTIVSRRRFPQRPKILYSNFERIQRRRRRRRDRCCPAGALRSW